jgi:lysophospholipase L1-like esterase
MTAPPTLDTGTVTWTVTGINGAAPGDATVTFVPAPTLLLATDPEPLTVLPEPVGPLPLEVDGSLDPVELLATDATGVTPTGWTWTAYLRVRGIARAAVTFTLDTGAAVDLTDVTTVVMDRGTPIIRGPQGETGPTGPQGPPGADGQDGADAVIPEHLSQTALSAEYGPGLWQTSRFLDAEARPRFDDRPAITWTNTLTTALTSPAEYKPKGVGGGVQVLGWNGQDDTRFAFFPGLFETANGANQDLALRGAVKPDANTAHRWPVVFAFTTSSTDRLEVSLYGALTSQYVIVEVNGRLVDDAVTSPPDTFTGNNYTMTLTFPISRPRLIRVWTTGGTGLAAVRLPTGCTVTKPTATGPVIAFVGDSFINGAGVSRDYPDQGTINVETFAPRLGRMLGARALILAGIGASGWITAGNGSKYASRTDDVMALSPDIVIFYGSTNDGTAVSTIGAEVTAALTAAAAASEVYVIGPLRSTIYGAVNDAIKTATEAAGRTFIDMREFITGTGSVTAPTGDGNADLFLMGDKAHPSFDGHRAIARRAFALITAARYGS